MNRIFGFLIDVKHELQKVVWPSKRDTLRYTLTVIVFSIIVSLILGAADYGLIKGFEAVLNK
jgi:preprotein translocase SecE subunit